LCLHCGEVEVDGPQAKYCSGECRRQVRIKKAADRNRGIYALATSITAAGNEAMIYYWRQVIVDALVERDGPMCWLCSGTIDFTIKSGMKGSDEGHSFDHVVPRSKGGSDDLENLRLAHWGCNRDRGSKEVAA
jgi:hypothetical protein